MCQVFCYTGPVLTRQAHPSGSSFTGWALLFLAMATAVILRFHQLGQAPPGLYRDEAFNGLDALTVLDGNTPLYFPDNNGREPLYIYLTSLAIAAFGRTAFAVRFTAALVGSLTTIVTYKLAKEWFGQRVGLLSAWMWAITLWPIHLSRIGFRIILLPFFLALTFWLATLAYRRRNGRYWFLAGLIYGLSFYTYLAVRFTPVLLALLAITFILTQRRKGAKGGREKGTETNLQSPISNLLFSLLGALTLLLPLATLTLQNPDLILGRTGQVSIFDDGVNNGRFLPTLYQQTTQALGMFFWRGDTILRHNPAGRPIFDFLMTIPFLIGVIWCVRRWRRLPAMTLLLWTAVMLGPTILAADTPHFLRAAGILPAVVIFPAIGLDWVWGRLETRDWRLEIGDWRLVLPSLLIVILIIGSTSLTILDYEQYSLDPETAYLFEAAATDLVADIQNEAEETVVFIDNRFWSGWLAIPFLVDENRVTRFEGKNGFAGLANRDTVVYAWPHASLDYLSQALPPPALISSQSGSLARGDLEEQPYPLYLRYHAQAAPDWPIMADFGNQLQLRQATVQTLSTSEVQIDLYWSTATAVTQPLIAFIHILDENGESFGLVAQDDAPPANGRWSWWQPGLIIHDPHTLTLPRPLTPSAQILIGLYDANSQTRLPINGTTADTWQLNP